MAEQPHEFIKAKVIYESSGRQKEKTDLEIQLERLEEETLENYRVLAETAPRPTEEQMMEKAKVLMETRIFGYAKTYKDSQINPVAIFEKEYSHILEDLREMVKGDESEGSYWMTPADLKLTHYRSYTGYAPEDLSRVADLLESMKSEYLEKLKKEISQ